MAHYLAQTLTDLEHFAQTVARALPDHAVITLTGELGAGKTTFVQSFGKALGVTQPITSPTFTLLHIYTLPNDRRIHHLDLYRMRQPSELEVLGLRELLATPHSITIIEWPQLATPLLPADTLAFDFTLDELDARIITYPDHLHLSL